MGAIARLQGHVVVLIHDYFTPVPGPGGRVVLGYALRGSDCYSVVHLEPGRSLPAWVFWVCYS